MQTYKRTVLKNHWPRFRTPRGKVGQVCLVLESANARRPPTEVFVPPGKENFEVFVPMIDAVGKDRTSALAAFKRRTVTSGMKYFYVVERKGCPTEFGAFAYGRKCTNTTAKDTGICLWQGLV